MAGEKSKKRVVIQNTWKVYDIQNAVFIHEVSLEPAPSSSVYKLSMAAFAL